MIIKLLKKCRKENAKLKKQLIEAKLLLEEAIRLLENANKTIALLQYLKAKK